MTPPPPPLPCHRKSTSLGYRDINSLDISLWASLGIASNKGCFLKKFWGHKSFFLGPLIPLFWTSGDICPGFQSKGGSLACFLTCVVLRFTSGATPADCIEVSMAAKPFQTTYLQMCPQALVEDWARPGLEPMTVHAAHSKHGTVNHSATPARLNKGWLQTLYLNNHPLICDD